MNEYISDSNYTDLTLNLSSKLESFGYGKEIMGILDISDTAVFGGFATVFFIVVHMIHSYHNKKQSKVHIEITPEVKEEVINSGVLHYLTSDELFEKEGYRDAKDEN